MGSFSAYYGRGRWRQGPGERHCDRSGLYGRLGPAENVFRSGARPAHTAFAYVFEGSAKFSVDEKEEAKLIDHPKLVVFGEGDSINVMTTDSPIRFLLVSGKPLREPIARYGPFVMNTRQEIEQALVDLQRGTFVR
jgi:redox-sensitive bicupin YhaK (pirin superfamily)